MMKTLVCLRCGHEWAPRRKTLPKTCPNPKCNSPYWDKPRRARLARMGGNEAYIPLTRGMEATVDLIDSDLENITWYAGDAGHQAWYACHKDEKSCFSMHVVIMERALGRCLVKGEVVDHKNRNSLDNRRSNLRLATKSQNAQNMKKQQSSSLYRGVTFNKARKRWVAQITHNYKSIGLGYFLLEIDAAKAYDKKAKELFGEFANLNFPGDV